MTNSDLIKEVNKSNSQSLTDWNNSLQAVWVSDEQRPLIYSREVFRRFWDIRRVEKGSKNKRVTIDDKEVLDRLDMVNKSLANIRQDIAAIVRDTVSQVLKERKKYVQIGYR